MRDGIYYENRHYRANEWENKVTICYKCQGFGHLSMNCRNETKCGKCNDNHQTKDCKAEKSNYSCTRCNTTDHPTWSKMDINILIVDINDLKKEFSDQFNKKIFVNPETTKIVDDNLENFLDKNKNKIYNNYSLNHNNLSNIIKYLPNGKSSGFSGVQPEMFKYGLSFYLVKIIGAIIEKMIQFSITPYLFNVGIIKPLVKDEKKEPTDQKTCDQ